MSTFRLSATSVFFTDMGLDWTKKIYLCLRSDLRYRSNLIFWIQKPIFPFYCSLQYKWATKFSGVALNKQAKVALFESFSIKIALFCYYKCNDLLFLGYRYIIFFFKSHSFWLSIVFKWHKLLNISHVSLWLS